MSVRLPAVSWKALLSGSATILILGLGMQLAFLMAAVGQVMLVKQYPGSADWSQGALYLLGMLLFFLTMAAGGYVTARLAPGRLLLHGTLVAIVAGGVSFIQSLNVGGLTLVGLLLFLLGIPFTLAGCWVSCKQTARSVGMNHE